MKIKDKAVTSCKKGVQEHEVMQDYARARENG